MSKFRSILPIRTCTKEYSSHRSYKKYLKIDFNEKCGYCDDHDSYSGYFHIDHFAPKHHFPHLSNSYYNLVYSCPYCNNAKSDKWPSNDETVNIVNDTGFIDPCNKDYDKHFSRSDIGEITPLTPLGEYIHLHLNFYLKRHSLIWILEKLDKKISKIETLIDPKKQNKSNINEKLLLLHQEYRAINNKLRSI